MVCSVQLRFIYIGPNHNKNYLRALFIVKSRPYRIMEKTLQICLRQHWRGKTGENGGDRTEWKKQIKS